MTSAGAVPVPGWASILVGVFWVAVPAGLLLGLAWRRVDDDRSRTRLQWAASLLFFVPHLPVLLAWNAAVPLVSLQRALLGAWLLVSAAVATTTVRRRPVDRRARRTSTVVVIAMTAAGLALSGPAVHNLLAPPVPVAGTVTVVSAGYRTSAPVLDVGGQRVRVTRDVAAHVRAGMHVEGTALRGTHHLAQVRIIDP